MSQILAKRQHCQMSKKENVGDPKRGRERKIERMGNKEEGKDLNIRKASKLPNL